MYSCFFPDNLGVSIKGIFICCVSFAVQSQKYVYVVYGSRWQHLQRSGLESISYASLVFICWLVLFHWVISAHEKRHLLFISILYSILCFSVPLDIHKVHPQSLQNLQLLIWTRTYSIHPNNSKFSLNLVWYVCDLFFSSHFYYRFL